MDCLVIYRVGDHGREGLCDPEGVPDTVGPMRPHSTHAMGMMKMM